MPTKLISSLIFLFSILPLYTSAAAWKVKDIPMVHLKDARKYACNPDGVLSPAAVDSIDAILFALEKKRGVQTALVAIKRVEGGDCYEFAMELGRMHGIGSSKQNTGLIIVLSTEDRCYQILTGRGLEGSLPDAICRRIENKFMLPYLKEGNWDEAMLQGVKAVDRVLSGDTTLLSEGTPGKGTNSNSDKAIAAIIVIGAFVLFFFIAKSKEKKNRVCPRCKKGVLSPISSTKIGGGRKRVV